METPNIELMRMAKRSLKGNWGLAAGTFFVYILIISGIKFIPVIGSLALLIVGGPFALGIVIFSLSIARDQKAEFDQLFQGFANFKKALGTYLLMVLFVLLWMLLLFVPGIIAAISYSMTFYILADDPSIGAMEAIKKSKEMMYGHKWKFFCLGLRFIGWILLCCLTFGIGMFWLAPYMQVSAAKFYEDVKGDLRRENV